MFREVPEFRKVLKLREVLEFLLLNRELRQDLHLERGMGVSDSGD